MFELNGFKVKFDSFDRPLRLWWKLTSDKSEVVQESYRIVIDGIYDSGVIRSDESVAIRINVLLDEARKYTAKVEVTNNYGETATAETTLYTGIKNFKGKFIAPKEKIESFTATKRFDIRKKVKSAILYTTALGVYFANLNGERVNGDILAPFWTSYNNTLEYQVTDVTDALRENNELSLSVGKGWYNGTIGFLCVENYYGTENAAFFQLHVLYEDGEEDVIYSDNTVEICDNKVLYNDLFMGEKQDLNKVGVKIEQKVIEYDYSKMAYQKNEPVRIIKVLDAAKYIVTPKGEHVVDFGKNITGFVKLKVKGNKGDVVTVKHAEILDKDGNFYAENLRRAKATDEYILDGEEDILYPNFTFHGFRYAEIEGIDFDINDVKACVIMSELEDTGNIETSYEPLNTLIANIKRGQRGNFVDVPTDCPQRDERCGWTGDANVFGRSACYNYFSEFFYEKWLDDLRSEQAPTGELSPVVPTIQDGKECAAIWGDVAVSLPYVVYEMYGDKTVLENQYESMRSYLFACERYIDDSGLITSGHQYGDWLSLDRDQLTADNSVGATDLYFVANVFFANSLNIMSKTANILGRNEDETLYRQKYENVVAKTRDAYFTKTGRVVSDTQTAYVLSLFFNIAREDQRNVLVELLKENLFEHCNHLTTGFAGTPFLLLTLCDVGLNDVASKVLLTHDYPGWLYAVDRGATTVWERWNGILPNGDVHEPSMNSFNHYSYGSVIEYLYRKVCGIDLVNAGFKKILLKPNPINKLKKVSGHYNCVYGDIKSSYEIKDDVVEYKFTVPCNTTATIVLPSGETYEVGSGEHSYSEKRIKANSIKITLNTFGKELIANPDMLEAISQASGGLINATNVSSFKEMPLGILSKYIGENGEEIFKGILERANYLLETM